MCEAKLPGRSISDAGIRHKPCKWIETVHLKLTHYFKRTVRSYIEKVGRLPFGKQPRYLIAERGTIRAEQQLAGTFKRLGRTGRMHEMMYQPVHRFVVLGEARYALFQVFNA